MIHKATIIIEKDEDGCYAYAPELEGCQTRGDTLDEAMANIKEVVELYLETMSNAEIRQMLSTAVLTTTLEAAVA
ncbi:MAG: type II toxin-antitoxin system HicB family antitoxin [Chloroflexi bacterium]|nr:type II toxin-antitoxin system HicB family antitoxin [Chloroflexota bacterium]